MKNFRIIVAIVSAVIMLFAFSSCEFIAEGNNGSSQNTESGSGYNTTDSTFYEKIDVSDKININVVNPTQSETRTLADVLDDIRPSVVEIYGTTSTGTAAGSGVIVDIQDSDGNGKNDIAYVITCHHVIAGTSGTYVKTLDGVKFAASLIGSDPKSDIGLIAVKGTDGDFDTLSAASWYQDSENLRYGMEVVAIGNPLGILGGTVTRGIISGIGREVTIEGKTMTLLQTDAAINSGNSGGGLFDADTGALIGIVNAGYAAYAADGLNFAIPSNVAREKESQLFATYSAGNTFGYIQGDYNFGAEFQIVQSGSPWSGYTYYVYIYSLDQYGTFAKSGLAVGDIIYSVTIGDETISLTSVSNQSITNLKAFLENRKIGDEVTVSYGRQAGNGITKSEAKFTIKQYVYGN
ncbi:MAG: trypsin-like peptidase domain-containing protein [Clostridia bacterium]|nr:trypsin-like peptidase domain-containing protein [Clostridia bacterium]